MLRYLKKYWLLLALSLLFAALTVAMTLYLPILIGQAVDLIVAPGKVEFSAIASLLLKMGVLIGATALSQWIMNACNNRITYRTVRDIRSDAFARLELLPLRYIDAHSYGEIVSRMIADVDQFADGLLMGFTQLFTGVAHHRRHAAVHAVDESAHHARRRGHHAGVAVRCELYRPQAPTPCSSCSPPPRGEQTGIIDEMVGNQKVVQAFGYRGTRTGPL